MALWTAWRNAIWLLRPAFSRLRTFLWFATAVAGFTVRTELLGVTSLVRALKIEARFYNKLVPHAASSRTVRERTVRDRCCDHPRLSSDLLHLSDP